MEVCLLRHGKVNYPPISMLSALDFTQWVESYDTNMLDHSSRPSEKAISMAGEAKAIVCSDLPRSLESMRVLGIDEATLIDSLFKEVDLPVAQWKFPKLSVRIWAILFRFAWFLGYTNESESLRDAQERAKKATRVLVELAEEHNTVLFVGHGILNRFIAKELRRLSWEGPKVPSREYWEYSVYKIDM
ncbi:MAG: histidine phosphatase family protein [Candidatus Thiodiazotropha sp.]|jgi:broad specificity phosphatase PhoE